MNRGGWGGWLYGLLSSSEKVFVVYLNLNQMNFSFTTIEILPV